MYCTVYAEGSTEGEGARAGMISGVRPGSTVKGGQREAADTGMEGESGGKDEDRAEKPEIQACARTIATRAHFRWG